MHTFVSRKGSVCRVCVYFCRSMNCARKGHPLVIRPESVGGDIGATSQIGTGSWPETGFAETREQATFGGTSLPRSGLLARVVRVGMPEDKILTQTNLPSPSTNRGCL